jgi:predicted ATPase with chaperone activity
MPMDFKDLLKQISGDEAQASRSGDIKDEYVAGQPILQQSEVPTEDQISNLAQPIEPIPGSTEQSALQQIIHAEQNKPEAPSTSFNLGSKNLLAGLEDIGKVAPTKAEDFFAPPSNFDDLGLSPVLVQDLLLKCLFYQGNATGKELATKVRLPLYGIVDPLLMQLSEEKYLEVTGSSGLGGHNKVFRLTGTGYKRANDVLKVSNYIGPAPVSLEDYVASVNNYPSFNFNEKKLQEAYSDIVLEPKAFEQIGPALISGKSMFVYGPPGTGKTTIAERITRCYGETIRVPYAVNIQGIPVRFFDFFLHQATDPKVTPGNYPAIDPMKDARWIEIKRPCIIVGPEFTIAASDLQYDASGPSYQFPNTIKANGGVFVVDDFGRQKEDPEIMLNRWIIPLDKQEDILNLKSGQQISVPFKIFAYASNICIIF